ncbi:MAG TPA: DUF948 domain-containing protein [Acidimicrobiales bacterium]|nr:DUF948 domain-containing protein [Acidimicrobiales bacterium]
MSGGEIAALIASLALLVLAIGLLFALSSLTQTLRSVRGAVEELRRETVPLVANLRVTVDQANTELVRIDGVMDRAESIGSTVDAASRLAYLALGNPVIKVLALAAGTTRAARRFRRRED